MVEPPQADPAQSTADILLERLIKEFDVGLGHVGGSEEGLDVGTRLPSPRSGHVPRRTGSGTGIVVVIEERFG